MGENHFILVIARGSTYLFTKKITTVKKNHPEWDSVAFSNILNPSQMASKISPLFVNKRPDQANN